MTEDPRLAGIIDRARECQAEEAFDLVPKRLASAVADRCTLLEILARMQADLDAIKPGDSYTTRVVEGVHRLREELAQRDQTVQRLLAMRCIHCVPIGEACAKCADNEIDEGCRTMLFGPDGICTLALSPAAQQGDAT